MKRRLETTEMNTNQNYNIYNSSGTKIGEMSPITPDNSLGVFLTIFLLFIAVLSPVLIWIVLPDALEGSPAYIKLPVCICIFIGIMFIAFYPYRNRFTPSFGGQLMQRWKMGTFPPACLAFLIGVIGEVSHGKGERAFTYLLCLLAYILMFGLTMVIPSLISAVIYTALSKRLLKKKNNL